MKCWQNGSMFNSEYALMVNVMVDKAKNPIMSAVRNSISQKNYR
ncbi:hypothetical protein [Clostridium estertheticum]|nr:hypothetical protein [Clostridium estertheticum]